MIVECIGNKDLLNLPKTAFLASSTIPSDMVLRCYDWEQKMATDSFGTILGMPIKQI